MFGFGVGVLTGLRAPLKIDPKKVPPPTPVSFPAPPPLRSSREKQEDGPSRPRPLVQSLQDIHRPIDIRPEHFDALGLEIRYGAALAELLPDPSLLPNFSEWERLTIDQAREQNHDTRLPLSNGGLSPGCQTFLERKKELGTANEEAFRAVRRIQPPKGKQQARLGNAYELFRCLETLTTYWDDPTAPPRPAPAGAAAKDAAAAGETTGSQGEPAKEAADDVAPSAGETKPGEEDDDEDDVMDNYGRSLSGSGMPGEYRHSLLSAFIKFVAYDFGCSVAAPRTEPRLHLASPASASPRGQSRKSYVSSGCIFIFRSPTKREAARAGIADGPVAAVSARATTSFVADTERDQDMAREIIAVLVTAQHRARERRTEKRFGEGEWWTTKPRWGGGSGGPIGREIEKDAVIGDKDAGVDGAAPPPKKPKKTLSVYDNYRMIRPPSLTWDRKTRYEAIGRQAGADYDDVFLMNSLFHHFCIVRVRVPNKLLEVLDGGADDGNGRSWGKLVMWRSKWYDLFVAEERIEAMKFLWAVFSYQMRKNDGQSPPGEDVQMAEA